MSSFSFEQHIITWAAYKLCLQGFINCSKRQIATWPPIAQTQPKHSKDGQMLHIWQVQTFWWITTNGEIFASVVFSLFDQLLMKSPFYTVFLWITYMVSFQIIIEEKLWRSELSLKPQRAPQFGLFLHITFRENRWTFGRHVILGHF